MKAAGILLVLGCLFAGSGGGTVMGRSGLAEMGDAKVVPRYYPGVFVDGCLIGESFDSSERNESGAARFFIGVGSCIDLPVSLVIDTLLLPYDACKASGQRAKAKTNYQVMREKGYLNRRPDAQFKPGVQKL